MFSHAPKRSPFFKAMGIFLALTFMLYNISFAAPEAAPAQAGEAEKTVITADDVGIAIDAGTIKAKHNGENNKIIVHIQDAHCNYEAQNNITRILDQITKECGINIISVEGAEGIVDTTWFKAFPDSEIRKEVATYFMKKGEITGAEFFSITSDYSGTIFGAETRDYYVKNLKSFTEVYPYKDAIEKYFQDSIVVADKLKNLIYSPELKEVDAKIASFDKKEIELSAFAEFLYKEASKNKIDREAYPNFKKLVETLEYEKKINFDIVDQERSNYIDMLSKKLSKEEMANLVTESIKFKKGHIKAADFYSYLRDLAKEYNIPMVQDYPNLFYYYIYTKLYDGIDNESLFKELDQIELALKKKLFKDPTQEELDRVSTLLGMYVNLANIELTNEDYDLFKEYSAKTSLDDMVSFMDKECQKYGLSAEIGAVPAQIKDNMPKMVDFYEIAMKRDNALIDNTLGQMQKEGKTRSVLIAGGFHTRGIKELLEKKGISYVVVTPKITKDVETPYIKVLTNQRTSLEDIITESAAMPGMGITASREEIVRSKSGSMLAPLNRVFYTIPLAINDPAKLQALSEAIGAVQGRTVEQAATESYHEMVRALVTGWLMKVKANADAGVWNQAVDNWQLLLGAFLKQYEENAKAQGIQLKADFRAPPAEITEESMRSVMGTVNAEFARIFEDFAKEERLKRGTPGQQAVRINSQNDIYEPLTENQHKGMNAVIGSVIKAGKPQTEKVNVRVKNETTGKLETKSVVIYRLPGLKEAMEAYNANPTFGEAVPLDIEAHPGRGPAHVGANVYMSAEAYDALNQKQRTRLARHELYHILNPNVSEEQACIAMADPVDTYLMDIRARFEKVEEARKAERQKKAEEMLIASTRGTKEVLGNIDAARKFSKENDSVKIVAVVSGSDVDQANWQTRLNETNGSIFNADGSSMVLSLQEKIGNKTREGNFLGTLLAYKYIKEEAAKRNLAYRDFVTLVGMLFGRGERMSPYTQIEGDRKPAIAATPANIDVAGKKTAFSAIEEALAYFTPVAKYLEKRGFRGILDKWGDETEIASIDMSKDPAAGETLADNDVIKVISVLEITDELANQKDWVVYDEKGNMLAQLSRNKKDALIEQLKALGIKPAADGKWYAGTSLGPVAMSYDVLDIASGVFAEEVTKDGVYFDFDPYFLMALAMKDRAQWDAAVKADKGLQKLVVMVPAFFEKVQDIKKQFKDKYGRELNVKILDLGSDVYWADIGQHSAMREKYMALNDTAAKGLIARRVANIPGERDENGNIIVNSTIAAGVKVKNSVIVNAKITGAGTIDGSVVMDSEFVNVNMKGAFAVRSVRLGTTTLGQNCGLYNSLGADNLTLQPVTDDKGNVYGTRHGSLLTKTGRQDVTVAENTDLRAKDKTYDVPLPGNPVSFNDAYNEMFGVSMETLDARRAEVLAEIERIKTMDASIKPLGFGTSGIRGLVSRDELKKLRPDLTDAKINEMMAKEGAMTDMECYINARGFIRYLKQMNEAGPGTVIAFGGDLRSTTTRIAMAIFQAIKDEGCVPDYEGPVSSPALAFYALQKGIPSIMITGSHIPEDRNGIKFTKKAGEVLKTDEKAILENVRKARNDVYAATPTKSIFNEEGMFKAEVKPVLPAFQKDAVMEMYVNRYLTALPADYLKGATVVLYQHSAVGRDVLEKIFTGLGAKVITIGRSDTFLPVDTEKVSAQTMKVLKDAADQYKPTVIISADGDSDRPLFADEKGNFLTGDRLGGLVSLKLEPKFVAVPDTTNDGVVTALREKGVDVVETQVGSPYIVAELKDVGWEANGGFLLGRTWNMADWKAPLAPLPTRDAALPLIMATRLALEKQQPVSELIARSLPPRNNVAGAVDNRTPGLENYTVAMGKEIMAKLKPSDARIIQADFTAKGILVTYSDKTMKLATAELAKELTARKDAMAAYFKPELGWDAPIVRMRWVDGVKLVFQNKTDAAKPGDVAHVRASGNAPDFRLIVTADKAGAGEPERAEVLAKTWTVIGPQVIKDYGMAAAGTPGVHAVRTKPAANTPEDRIVKAIEQGKPFIVTPYEEPKVWGKNGIGEYWYGAEAGKKSSTAAMGADKAPMAAVMAIAPEEVLGKDVVKNFGETMPLVKILTPQGRLSVQFHDAKNELWIVTGVTGDKPSIILGFSQKAVAEYGEAVAKKYREALEKYGQRLNQLIDVLEKSGYKDLLAQTKDAEKAANVAGKDNKTVREVAMSYTAAKQTLNEFYNARPVKAGDVIPIPSGTLHALGAGVEVVEPQIAGPTQSLEDGATYPVRYYFPGYERPGSQKKLDIDRIGEMRAGVAVEEKPVVITNENGVLVERLPGGFEDKGLEVHRITIQAGSSVEVPALESFHNLVALEGKAKVVVNGVEYDIPQASPRGEMLLIPATAAAYKITAGTNVTLVDTFTPVPETIPVTVNEGALIPGTSEPVSQEKLMLTDFPNMMSTFDQLYVIDRVATPAILKDRRHELLVREGAVRIEKADGTVVAELNPGQKYVIPENMGEYTLVKIGDRNAEIKVDYEKTEAEKAVYMTYSAVRKHMKEIQAGQVDLILPEEMFVAGGKNTPGSAQWEEEQLRRYVSDKIRITTYSAKMGIREAARRSVSPGAVGILVATKSSIKEADRNDAAVRDFLQSKKGKVRVLAIPDIDKEQALEGKGWFFNREVEGTGLLLASVTPQAIATEGEGNAADDLQKLMAQLTGKSVPRQFLYYMLSYDEIGAAMDKLPVEFQQDPLGWLRFVVQNLLLKMPIKPFDATEQLEQRRKVMWSV